MDIEDLLDLFPTVDHSLNEYERIIANTEWVGDCLMYMGYRGTSGYGRIACGPKGRRGEARTHQVVWKHHHGPIPEGHVVRHKCDNPPCINIEHLETGTPADNTQDMMDRGRHYTGKGPRSVPWVNHLDYERRIIT